MCMFIFTCIFIRQTTAISNSSVACWIGSRPQIPFCGGEVIEGGAFFGAMLQQQASLAEPIPDTSLSSQCYACTDPGSIASTHAYLLHPKASCMYMHTSCFLEFAADYEKQTNLRNVLNGWALCSHQGAYSRRSMRALECVLKWQREQREMWKASKADTMYTKYTKSLVLRTFILWAPTPPSENDDRYPPPLIDSSSENDDRYSPPMTDSSSESD